MTEKERRRRGSYDTEPTINKINRTDKSCHCRTSPLSCTKEVLQPLLFSTTNEQTALSTTLMKAFQPSDLFIETSKNQVVEAVSTITSDGSETTLSVMHMNDKLPLLVPRDHGSHCALEVSIMEKHKKGCCNKKFDREGRNTMEDQIGSYDVVNRVVIETCIGPSTGNEDAIKGSAKSFKLNDPSLFGKNMRENRSRIEPLPILPDYSSSVFQMDTPKPAAADVLSVYIRLDKSEKVPPGFQKMHYKGDSCKLHDPTERSKQILALQKVIDETSSGAEIAKSTKRFSSNMHVLNSRNDPTKLPETLFPPVHLVDSNESADVKSLKTKRKLYRSYGSELLANDSDSSIDEAHSGFFSCFKKNSRSRNSSLEDDRECGEKRPFNRNQTTKNASTSQSSDRRGSPQF